MALMINKDCINCDVCAPECPNNAIFQGDDIYEIDPDLCTECVGKHDEPLCQQICPVECIVVNPDYQESQKELLEKYKKINAGKE